MTTVESVGFDFSAESDWQGLQARSRACAKLFAQEVEWISFYSSTGDGVVPEYRIAAAGTWSDGVKFTVSIVRNGLHAPRYTGFLLTTWPAMHQGPGMPRLTSAGAIATELGIVDSATPRAIEGEVRLAPETSDDVGRQLDLTAIGDFVLNGEVE